MSSLSAVGRSAAAQKNDRSAAARKVDRSAVTNKNDRTSLCSFTFSDGRRCRTPRDCHHPHFCFYHAQKEARATAAEKLGKDLAYFFSGDYLSACDLSTALARLIPAVVRGDVKPRAARTVAYLAQTLLQAIHISEDEYINACGTDGWRKSLRNSVKYNHDYRFPPAAEPQPQPQPQLAQPQTQVPQRASTLPSNPPQPAAITSPALSPKATPPQPAEISASCHCERSEEPASSSSSASPTPPASQPPTISPQASSPANPSAVPQPHPPRRPCLKRRRPPTIQPRRCPIPTPLRQPFHPLSNARLPPQIATPTPCTSTTTTASSSTANPFRINTCTAASQLLILNHLHKH